MKPAPAAPLGRLVPLAVGVCALHIVLLDLHTRVVAGSPPRELHRFTTRSVQAMPPPAAPESVALALPPPPVPVRAPAPPRPRAAPKLQPIPMASAPADAPAMALPVALVAAGPDAPKAAAPAPRPAHVPPSVHMKYEVTATYRGLPLQGEGELTWRHDGKEYELELEARNPLLGGRRQRSVGRITPHGLEPLHFWDKSRSEQATHFDRENGQVTFSNNKPDVPLAAGVQDRLSVILQLGALVAARPARYPPGTQVAIPTASTSDAETWNFAVEGEEELQLPGGTVRALKLQRLPRREYDQKVELWLAPRMDYAPVRIRLTNPNGDTVDQRWASTDKG